jgi:hypothetical protein
MKTSKSSVDFSTLKVPYPFSATVPLLRMELILDFDRVLGVDDFLAFSSCQNKGNVIIEFSRGIVVASIDSAAMVMV